MLGARTLAALFSLFTLAASAQIAADPIARVFHPTAPLPSYDVATIKPFVYIPGASCCGTTARELIRSAYGFGTSYLPAAQVVGGPPWIDKDNFQVDGKPPADLELAMRNMTYADKFQHEHAMQQSLLADRFHLKVHFEVREMPVYALVPAKGGIKLKKVAAPPPHDFTTAQPASTPNDPVAPETFHIGFSGRNTTIVRAHAISMAKFISMLSSNLNLTGDRPVADQTGFTGYFDIDDLRWANAESANAGAPSDAPSLATALEQTLGLRLVLTKAPVEVVVIDSIDHPSEN